MNNYIIKESNSEEAELIVDRLVKYNLSKVPGKQEVPLLWINRVIEDTNGEIIAGILSEMYCWNCIYIDALWIKEEYRKNRLGTRLLKEVEKIAKEKDCHLIHLDTFDFQAKDFYIKHGYEIFGILDQCPENHKRYFMKKKYIVHKIAMVNL
ncbi:GNAT family N-acetyltransferase [Clostridium botulinum]|nr:GNAT family N-acetyltransferase [Clostridium botulinum]NFB19568.1 GNAT family N-acetyltransferase [Clostridium botulinum]NFT56657.1 GNAT family N-acetyltransferase [Clostridium botulinum]